MDVVNLRNGDRITCEIKKLDRSVLTISTDPLGKASVHWGDIATLVSPRQFDVQLASGEHYLGALAGVVAGHLDLTLDSGGSLSFAMSDVVRLAPIGASTWSRMDGGIDAGFSFAQADLETHWTLNGSATYRSPRYVLSGSLTSQMTIREQSDSVKRNSLGLRGDRSFGNRWYTTGWSQVQQNQELSLDLRALGGGGVGRDISHTDHRLFSLFTGLAYTHEQFSGESADQSAEAALGAQLDFFTPGHEDFLITNNVISYYALTGRARFRLELQSAWRHEFYKDIYYSVNGFESVDSSPPPDLKSHDFGISITLGWKF